MAESSFEISVGDTDSRTDRVDDVEIDLDTPASSTLHSSMGRSAEDYRSLTDIEHVLRRPEMYIGPIKPMERSEYVLKNSEMYTGIIDMSEESNSSKKGLISKDVVSLASGIVRLFIEIIANAADNASDSRRAGVDPGSIFITMNRTTVTVKSEGLGMVVGYNPQGHFIPSIAFGKLRSGTNFGDECHAGGCNGIGSKATNIFSTNFTAEICDGVNGKRCVIVWSNNMRTMTGPYIEDYHGPSTVSVSYSLDFMKFGLAEYPDEAFYLFGRIAADTSFTSKIPVYFNSTKLDYSNIEDYAKLYFGSGHKTLVHRQWPAGVPVETDKHGKQRSLEPSIQPMVEMIVVDKPGKSHNISFANSLMTSEGGVHVDAAIKSVTQSIVDRLNDASKKMVGDMLDSNGKKPSAPRITIRDVRLHISLIVSVKITSPQWNAQTKTKLLGPNIFIHVPDVLLRRVDNWLLMERLKEVMKSKRRMILTRTSGKKKRHVKIKGTDANLAGTRDSHKCVVVLVEGNSAATNAAIMTSAVPKGRDYIGTSILRGKLLNTIKANEIQLAKNKEITELVEMVGLVYDRDYTSDENFRTLRYGKLMIMTDADVDGQHIKGLILAFFAEYFPSLLQRGYVVDYRTPYLRLKKGRESKRFFSEKDYEDWKRDTPDYKKWDHKYCKGLASSSKAEILEDFAQQWVVGLGWDDNADNSIRLAFDKDKTNERKLWLAAHNPDIPTTHIDGIQPITTFINEELIIYSLASVIRHIPSIDGLNPARRKLLHTALNKWGYKKGGKKRPCNIGTFASHTRELTNYHHGDNLGDVMASMAQSFVGANNLPYFNPDSQVGSRVFGGKDAGKSRYTSAGPSWWLPYVYCEEDLPLLTKLIDEGKEIEPAFMLPIIPIHVVNGANGIATAYSTFIPNHHPLDVVNWLRCRITGEELPVFNPWYRGFTGDIGVVHSKGKVVKIRSQELTEENDEEFDVQQALPGASIDETIGDIRMTKDRSSMITYGCFSVDRNVVTIKELPIGCWTKSYEDWLMKLREKKVIKDYKTYSTDEKVHFEITDFFPVSNDTEERPLLISDRTLRLRRSYGMSNMVLLDERYRPHHLKTVTDVMEFFFNFRIKYYQQRRQSLIDRLAAKIESLQGKIKFIQSILNGTLVIFQGNRQARPQADIYRDMDRLEIDRKHLDSSFLGASAERVQRLIDNMAKAQAEMQVLIETKSQDMWLRDLEAFEQEYLKRYPKDREIQGTNNIKDIVIDFNSNKSWRSRRKAKASSSAASSSSSSFGAISSSSPATVTNQPEIIIDL